MLVQVASDVSNMGDFNTYLVFKIRNLNRFINNSQMYSCLSSPRGWDFYISSRTEKVICGKNSITNWINAADTVHTDTVHTHTAQTHTHTAHTRFRQRFSSIQYLFSPLCVSLIWPELSPCCFFLAGKVLLASDDWIHHRPQRVPRVSDHRHRDPLHFQVDIQYEYTPLDSLQTCVQFFVDWKGRNSTVGPLGKALE